MAYRGGGVLTVYDAVSARGVLGVKPGVATGLFADPLLRHERRAGHVVHAVLDAGLVGSGPSDDADHRHLSKEDNQETKDPKTHQGK